jgi:hypothetical protein
MFRRWTGAGVALALLAAGCGGSVGLAVPTRTPQPSPTPSATPLVGPRVTFVGLATSDDFPTAAIGSDDQGRPIFEQVFGRAFLVVVEGRPGTDGRAVGSSAFEYDPEDPNVRPDLQVLVSRSLGDGSAAVCDNMTGDFGGIPAIDPPSFDVTQPISDAINDFGCRFDDGTGNPGGRAQIDACTKFSDGEYRFVSANSSIQFCARIAVPFSFPEGDTIVTARLRDVDGMVGNASQIVVRINPNATITPVIRSAVPDTK